MNPKHYPRKINEVRSYLLVSCSCFATITTEGIHSYSPLAALYHIHIHIYESNYVVVVLDEVEHVIVHGTLQQDTRSRHIIYCPSTHFLRPKSNQYMEFATILRAIVSLHIKKLVGKTSMNWNWAQRSLWHEMTAAPIWSLTQCNLLAHQSRESQLVSRQNWSYLLAWLKRHPVWYKKSDMHTQRPTITFQEFPRFLFKTDQPCTKPSLQQWCCR